MRAGEIVDVDFGVPVGSEPGFGRPAIVVTADLILAASPRTVHVVPLTGNISRALPTEILVDDVGLDRLSAAQCHLCTAVSTERITRTNDNLAVGPTVLAQIRAVLGDMLEIP